jgi:tRNA threonylcarbamoyladenosine biosynthesis protein TsaB
MSYILHLDTSTKVCSVAISENGKTLAFKESKDDKYSHGENLTLFIQEVIVAAGITMNKLSAVSLASGPGSYTGLRIGASTAKGICYALKIPLIAIDSLRCIIEIAAEKHPNKNLCAVIDARRMEVYNLIVNADKTSLKEISADIIDENTYNEYTPFVYFGDGSAKLEPIWTGQDKVIDTSFYNSAVGQAALSYEMFLKEDFVDVAYWEPFYLKDFIAGVKKPK